MVNEVKHHLESTFEKRVQLCNMVMVIRQCRVVMVIGVAVPARMRSQAGHTDGGVRGMSAATSDKT